MRIVIVGGGPAGLYFALLMKLADRRHEVTLLERNPRGATFGWGVVFSEQTLSYLAEPDPPTFEVLDALLARWDNVDIVHRGAKVTIRGNRFSGIARLALLEVLQRRCEEVGVDLRFEQPVEDVDALPAADLLVGADGVRSVVRERHREAFEPSFDVRPNQYIWLGTPRLFHGLTLTFRTSDAGLFIAHSYKYGPDRSTFIVECAPEVWQRARLDDRSEGEGIAYLERVFADDLEGQPLLSNASRWINFWTLRTRRWSHGRTVLLGDALHTAHFSIGSGTKLALEDAIALARALGEEESLARALAAFEAARRPIVERYQTAADASAEWFEGAAADLHHDPLAFAYRAMTRSEKVDHENLRRRDPEFVAAYERSRRPAISGTGRPPRA